MVRISLLSAGVICALAWAQAPPDDKPATISGTVTNALTGEPLLRAHVSLRGMAGATRQTFGALTDAAGKFSMSVPAGTYSAVTERVGFSRTADRQGRMGAQVQVRPGDKKDDIQIKLNPNGAITGRVTDADGEPVEGISVMAEGGSIRSAPGNATTDEKGEFRIGGLGPGKYRIRARTMNSQTPPEIRSDGTAEVQYAQTYYPNSLTAKEAARVNLGIGAEVGGINIQLLRTPIVRVSGTVSGAPPGERVMIEAVTADGRGRQMGMLQADGTFRIWRLDPGKYSVIAIMSSWNGVNLRSAAVEVEIAGSNVDHLELRMLPPMEIKGQVEFEDEQAKQGPQPQRRGPPQQQPSTPPTPPQMTVLLRDISGRIGFSGSVESDGSFKLENVTPGRYRVSSSWGGVYVKSMRLGSQSIDGKVVDLTGGTNGAPLSLLISSATAEISGVVTDENGPAAQVPVAVVTVTGGMPTFTTMTSTGDDGSYRLSGVPPGKYKLVASEDNLFARPQDPDSDDDDVIEINQGDKLTRDIKLKPPGGN